ncbi:hypothetical protein [Arsenicibacter rosenii]|nr:hypothetical protein [Arsenicibacter rosenii]
MLAGENAGEVQTGTHGVGKRFLNPKTSFLVNKTVSNIDQKVSNIGQGVPYLTNIAVLGLFYFRNSK